MFRKIVVGVNEEYRGARDAITLAERLLAPGGELTLLHVYPARGPVYPGVAATVEAPAREAARALLERAQGDAGVRSDLRWRAADSLGQGLHELCEIAGADLLVVGSSRHSLRGRVKLGDATHAALNGAPCAVAIAPRGYAVDPGAIREIGVGYDGSPESEHALSVARGLAAELGAKVSALQAVSIPNDAFTAGVLPLSDAVEGLVDGARQQIAALGNVEPYAAYGQAAEELAIYSGSVDLLIVGSRGYGPIGRLMHGSTSGRLVRSARGPVLVLPRVTQVSDATTGRAADADALAGSAEPVG